MKKILLFFIVTVVFNSEINAQVSSADTMVHRIFNAIKSQDEKKLLSLFPDYIQMKNLLKNVLMQEQRNLETEEDRKRADSAVNEILKEVTEDVFKTQMQKQFLETFLNIITKGKELGLNWKNIELVKYTIDSAASVESKVKTMDGILSIKESNKIFYLSFDQVIWDSERKVWFGVSFKDLYLASEQDKINNLP